MTKEMRLETCILAPEFLFARKKINVHHLSPTEKIFRRIDESYLLAVKERAKVRTDCSQPCLE